MDAQAGADPLQGLGPVGRTIIDHQLNREATLEYCLLENSLDIQRFLASTKRTVGQQAGGIVHQ